MGKIMINGEQYPSFVVKTGLDDSSIVKDKTWSSSKINEELEDVRGELDIIVEEANKNTSINDEVESLTTVWSSKKTSNELATKQENMSVRKVYARRNSSANKYILLATIDMRVLTNLGQPLRIKGVIGNMANDITNIDLTINARNGFVKKILYGTVTHKNFLTNDVNIIITKSDDGKTAYVYLDCISVYAYIDAEIYLGSVHYSVPSTFDLVETMQGTEYTNLLDTNYVVIENVINDTTSSATSTYSSAKIDVELLKKLTKNYTITLTDANTVIDSGNGLHMYRIGAGCLNIPVKRIGIIISNNYYDNTQYIRITQTYMTNDDKVSNGLIYMRYGMSNDNGSTYTWSDWKQISYLDDSSTGDTTSTWSSSKIASELKTSSNKELTEIAFTNSTNWSNSSGNLKTFYMVRNGWCFLHVVAHCNKVANDNNSVVYSGLPMPPFQVYGKFVGEDNTYEPCNLTVATNGQMLLRGGTAGKDYSFTYTYPVA